MLAGAAFAGVFYGILQLKGSAMYAMAGATVVLSIVAFYTWLYAAEAEWFAQQLETLWADAAIQDATTRRS